MAKHTIVHFEIPAADAEKLAEFYRQLFGWEIAKVDIGGTPYYSITTTETDQQGTPTGPGINGGMYARTEAGQHVINYVNVESVDEYLARAKSLGARELIGKMPVPGMGWFAQLQDLDGNTFGIWQEDSSAG